MEREHRDRKGDGKERYRTECEGLPHGWSREVVIRKTGDSAGRVDIYYYRYDTRILLWLDESFIGRLIWL